jgi:hypothetical protein
VVAHVGTVEICGAVETVGCTAWASDGGAAPVGNARTQSGAWRAVQDFPGWALGHAKQGGFR